MRWVATVTALWLCALPSALAQSEDWLVLPTLLEDEAAWVQPTVTEVSRELRRQGVGVWSSDRAVSAFRTRGSAAPPVLSDDLVQSWESRSQQALRKLAQGDYPAAMMELEQVQKFSALKLVALNRDPARAQTVLDTCLYLVRALAETGDEMGAARQAEECVRSVPSAEPTRQMHPPSALELYEKAAAPGSARSSALLVESEPSNCGLRINGVLVGETPFQMSDLYPGRYQVQVECEPGALSRVHTVAVPRGSTSLFVFDRFDRSVRTTPLLHLRYESPPDVQRLARDVRELARTLPAPAVVVASEVSAEVLELRVATGTQVEPTVVRIGVSETGPTSRDVVDATSALLAGDCLDLSGEEPLVLDCSTGEPVEPVATDTVSLGGRPPPARFIPGVTLASVGTASLLAGYGLLIARRSAGDDWVADPNSLDAQGKWLSIGTGVIATSAIGGGLLVASMPLVLPYEAKTPWWAWLGGGLGVAAAAGSIVSAVTASGKPPQSCTVNTPDPTACVERRRDTDRAIALGATAAPLLTMPLVYLLRKDDKKVQAQLSPSVVVGRQGGALGLRGAF